MKLKRSYVAGIFDGEGCIDFYKSRKQILCRVTITNTNLELLERIQASFGGAIEQKTTRKEHWKPSYQLRFGCTQAVNFIDKILPYLIVKREQAITLIHWYEARPTSAVGSHVSRKTYTAHRPIHIACMERMKWLNRRGILDGTPDPMPLELVA